MVKYREILRLAAMGMSQNSIAFSCGCAQSTVSDVLRAARAHQLSWPLPEEMDDAAIRAVIYPKESRKSRDKAAIDHEHVASELMRRGMTMSLLGAAARGVSVMCEGKRIAIHERATRKGEYRTNREHMPDAHRDFVEWDGDRFRRWARDVGPSCEAVVDGILRSRKVEQQSYRSCWGVLGLAKAHGEDLLEESCAKALLRTPRPSYKVVKGILAALEKQREEADGGGAYLRGSEYYESFGNGNGDPEEGEE